MLVTGCKREWPLVAAAAFSHCWFTVCSTSIFKYLQTLCCFCFWSRLSGPSRGSRPRLPDQESDRVRWPLPSPHRELRKGFHYEWKRFIEGPIERFFYASIWRCLHSGTEFRTSPSANAASPSFRRVSSALE